jgi:hypothetical protein
VSASLDWTTVRPVTRVVPFAHYLEVPAFVFTTTWLGASEIVGQLDYQAGNVFSLLRMPAEPSSIAYVPCIRYRTGDAVTRYRLWSDPSGTVPAELYAGQRIGALFSIEIWSINGGDGINPFTITNSAAIRVTTSVRTVPVYPFTSLSDVSLATASQISTMLNTNTETPELEAFDNVILDANDGGFTSFDFSAAPYSFPAGNYILKYVDGAFLWVAGGGWMVGNYGIYRTSDHTLIASVIGLNTAYASEALAKAAYSGHFYGFTLSEASTIYLKLSSGSPFSGNTSGTPDPTFTIERAMELPLNFETAGGDNS